MITAPKGDEILKKTFVKIGRPGEYMSALRSRVCERNRSDAMRTRVRDATPPGYKVTKVREPSSPNRNGLLFQVMLPEIKEGVRPLRRFMSAFEQRREIPNRAIQYLLVRALVMPSVHCTLIDSDMWFMLSAL